MKTIEEIFKEIKHIEGTPRDELAELKRPKLLKLKKRLSFLRQCRLYLETNPSEVFIKKEIERMDNRINLILAGFSLADSNIALPALRKMRKAYEKEHDVPRLQEQLKALKFLYK